MYFCGQFSAQAGICAIYINLVESRTMKNRAKALPHPRRADLNALVGSLNIWATAPEDTHRTKALRMALRKYQQAVKAGAYPAISDECCKQTRACAVTPPDVFQEFFGSPEQSASKLPWEDQ